jgi:subtilisin family serine protease
LNTAVTNAILTDLGRYGRVRDIVAKINAVTLQADSSSLATIRLLPYVSSANPDAKRSTGPATPLAVDGFASGLNTWDLDAINVTDFGAGRTIAETGAGVYVAVLDSGLVENWRFYFPADHIAAQYGIAFGGGGGEQGSVSSQPNKWEHDQNSHGTHVTSTILGYRFPIGGSIVEVNGTAPGATVIPVKVLNQNGSGWSSVVARGIVYATDLKIALGKPLVINMSLGGPELDAVEKAAIDYAIANGVVVVASAGNAGTAGMGYPGAYGPVISAAASGWIREWTTGTWWRTLNVPDPGKARDFYIAEFSSRELAGQDLDVAAPGSWVVGPYQVNGQLSWFFLGGTSMASPHVAGVAALMLQKNALLSGSDIEVILESTALALPAGSRNVINPNTGAVETVSWGNDASGSGMILADKALAATP